MMINKPVELPADELGLGVTRVLLEAFKQLTRSLVGVQEFV